MREYENLFGLHIPFRLTIERELCNRSSRLIEGDSSNLLLELQTNKLSKLDQNDFMNGSFISWQSFEQESEHFRINDGEQILNMIE